MRAAASGATSGSMRAVAGAGAVTTTCLGLELPVVELHARSRRAVRRSARTGESRRTFSRFAR